MSGPLKALPPVAPSVNQLSISAGNQGVLFEWVPPVTDAYAYNIYRATFAWSYTYTGGVNAVATLLTPVASIDDTSPLGGQSWYYGVEAYNGESSTAAVLPVVFPKTLSWANAAATGDNGDVFLEWDNFATPSVSYYQVYRSTSALIPNPVIGNAIAETQTVQTSLTITGDAGELNRFWIAPVLGLAGVGPVSLSIGAYANSAPAAPQNLSATGISFTDQVQVDWDAPALGSSPLAAIIARMWTAGVVNQSLTLPANTLSHRFTVTRGVENWFDVRAVDIVGGMSGVSVSDTVNVPGIAVEGGSTFTNGSLKLLWTPPVQSQPVGAYLILRATSPAFVPAVEVARLSGATVSFTAETITPGTSVWYRVHTYVDTGLSGPLTASASSTVSALAPPAALTAFASGDAVSLIWDSALLGANPGVTGYRVYYKGTGPEGFVDVAELPINLTVVAGLNPNGLYDFSVASLGGGSEGGRSLSVSALVQIPMPPITWATQDDGGAITLSWTAAVLNGDTVDEYLVYRGDTLALAQVLGSTSALQFVDPAPLTFTTHYYLVVSSTAGYQSSLTVTAGSYLTATALSAPGSLTAVAQNSRVSLFWDAVNGATHYEIYRAVFTAAQQAWYTNASFTALAVVDGLTYVDLSASNGLLHAYEVVTRRVSDPNQSVFESPRSLSKTVIPFQPPGAVPNGMAAQSTLMPVPDGSGASLLLSWSPAALGTFGLGLQYEISVGSSASNLTPLALTPTTAFLDTGRVANSVHYYQVRAVDNRGNRGLSNTAEAFTFIYTPVGTPSSATVSLTGNDASLGWAAPSLGSYPLKEYAVFRSVSGFAGTGGSLLTRTSAVTYTDFGVGALGSDRWFYDIYALDTWGSGVTSSASVQVEAVFASVTFPSRVLGVSVTAQGSNVLVSWVLNPPSEVLTGYRVGADGNWWVTAAPTASFYALTGTAFGTSMNVQVQAQSATDTGNSSTAYSYTHLPLAPVGVTILASADVYGNTISTLELDWQDVNGAEDYYLYRSSAPIQAEDIAWLPSLTNTAVSAYRDSSALLGQDNFYRVASWANGFFSSASVQVSGVPSLAPNPPASLLLTASAAEISLGWTLPTGGAPREVFVVYRASYVLPSNPSSGSTQLLSSAAAYIVSAGTPGVREYFAVAAANSSSRSSLVSGDIWPVPQSPILNSALSGFDGLSNTVSINWTGVPGTFNQYDVLRSSNANMSSAVILTRTASLSYTWFDPAPTGLDLFYAVSAFNQVSSTVSSAQKLALPSALPQTPASLNANPAGAGIKLTWNSPLSTDVVTAYRIYRATASLPSVSQAQFLTQVAGNSLSCLVDGSGLIPGFPYRYYVSAVNSRGEGNFSVVTGIPSQIQPPLPPLGLTAIVGFSETSNITRVELSWISATTAVSTYEIYRSTAAFGEGDARGGSSSALHVKSCAWNDPACFQGNSILFTDFEVQAEQPYFYAVTATNSYGPGVGESQAMPLATAITPYRGAGFPLITTAQAGIQRVDLVWGPPADLGSAGGPVSYKLYRSKNPINAAFKVVKSLFPLEGFPIALMGTAYTDINFLAADFGLSPSTFYRYYVTAVDSLGREAQDAFVSVAVIPVRNDDLIALPPVAGGALGLTVIAGNNQVRLQWLVKENQKDFKFNVYRRFAGPVPPENDYEAPVLASVGPQPIEFSSLALGVLVHQEDDLSANNLDAYYYSIAAVTAEGEGLKSPEWLVTPFRPLNPSLATATAKLDDKAAVQVSWGATIAKDVGVEGYALGGYRVYRSQDAGATYALVTSVASTTLKYTDQFVEFGRNYVYRLVPFDVQGNEGLAYPLMFTLVPQPFNNVLIYRNAFNPAKGESVDIQAVLTQPGKTWIKIYTSMGRYVETLVEMDVPPRASPQTPFMTRLYTWDGNNFNGRRVASGVYIVHVEAPGYSANGRVAVIK